MDGSLALWDIITIIGYLGLCVAIGIWAGGRPDSSEQYFTASRSVPWWAVSFSIVATETSMLTVISVPAVAYLGTLEFLQIAFGYVLGRIAIAVWMLPRYFQGAQTTAYTFFKERFGTRFQQSISVVFLITRLLADGVRLFGAAIPLKLVTGLDYPTSVAIIAVLTLAYTFYGGLKSVIWIDVLQLVLYLVGGFLIISFVQQSFSGSVTQMMTEADKFHLIVWPGSFSELFSVPYNIVGALIGGFFLTLASHGTDHLIVQRLLACPSLKDARKALVTSGFLVLGQFLLFLWVGFHLYAYFDGQSPQALNLTRADEILPWYVVNVLPTGLSGLIIAGLFAAAMSTLSSSLAALSSSTLFDLIPQLSDHPKALVYSRWSMVAWTLVFVGFAVSFSSMNNPIIELGLGIAGFTYGGLLGAFFLGQFTNVSTRSAVIGLWVSVIGMTLLITFGNIAWPWYTFFGLLIYLTTALLIDPFIHQKQDPNVIHD
ncbi:MAG: sodium:solute symporter [Bacteroidota bacterium]